MKALGIDIGASSIKTILFDGDKIKSSLVATPKNKKEFIKALKEISSKAGKVDHFGVGFAGVLDFKTGKVLSAPNLLFLKDFELGKFLFGLNKRAKWDNDAKCSMRAEIKFGGHGKDLRNAVLIAIGTGIGGAIVIDGKIYYGKGAAGELGHMVLDKMKSYEQLAGGKALKHYGPSEIAKVGTYTGMACANIVRMLNPDTIILSGGVVAKNPIIARHAVNVMKRHISPRDFNTKILVSKLGEFAGAIGAAWM